MKNKRTLFVINFDGDYEVWLSTSKEELAKNYKETTGIDIFEDGGTIDEIPLERLVERFKFEKSVTQEFLESEFNNLQNMDEDVMFFTNML